MSKIFAPVNVVHTLSSTLTMEHEKLECLSLKSFFPSGLIFLTKVAAYPSGAASSALLLVKDPVTVF